MWCGNYADSPVNTTADLSADIAEAVTMMMPSHLVRGDSLYQIDSPADEVFFIVSEALLHIRAVR